MLLCMLLTYSSYKGKDAGSYAYHMTFLHVCNTIAYYKSTNEQLSVQLQVYLCSCGIYKSHYVATQLYVSNDVYVMKL